MIQSNSEYYTEKSALKLRDLWRKTNKRLDHFLDRPRNPEGLSIFIKGAIFGFIILFLTGFISRIFQGIGTIFRHLAYVIGIWFAVQLGLDQKYKWFIAENEKQKAERYDGLSAEEQEKANAMNAIGVMELSFDFIFAILTFLCFFGTYFWDFFAVGFPILHDLKLETDLLTVNIFYWIKTATTFLQFVFMFFVMARVKRRIKQKINNRYKLDKRMDGFDRAFFAPTI